MFFYNKVTKAEWQCKKYMRTKSKWRLGELSVNCERLFSAAKVILSDTRKRTSTYLFEALVLLLKVNSQHGNVHKKANEQILLV